MSCVRNLYLLPTTRTGVAVSDDIVFLMTDASFSSYRTIYVFRVSDSNSFSFDCLDGFKASGKRFWNFYGRLIRP